MSYSLQPSEEQYRKLDELDSSFHISSEIKNNTLHISCTLFDRATKKPWHSASASDASEAFQIALNTASRGSKPKTVSDIAAEAVALADENAKLRELVDQLKAQGSETAAVTAPAIDMTALGPRRRSGS